MNLHEVYLAAQLAKSDNGGASVDLSDYYTKSQTDSMVSGKVDKAEGMGLSENSFTDDEKTKLAALENYDDTNMTANVSAALNAAAINKSVLGYQRKNLLKNTAALGTNGGISYTVNADESVTTGTGTVSGVVSFAIINSFTFKAGVSYILSGAPNDNSTETRLSLISASGNELEYRDSGSGTVIKFDEDTTCNIRARFGGKNFVLSEAKTFYPMIRYAEITDDSYEPYKPSVEERLAALEAAISGGDGA